MAAAVAAGRADTGLGILAAARAFGLDFVPVAGALRPGAARQARWMPRMLAPLWSLLQPEFRAAVEKLGGYWSAETGQADPLAEVGPKGFRKGEHGQRLRGPRLAPEVALPVAAAELAQGRHLGLGLHAFGHGRQAEASTTASSAAAMRRWLGSESSPVISDRSILMTSTNLRRT